MSSNLIHSITDEYFRLSARTDRVRRLLDTLSQLDFGEYLITQEGDQLRILRKDYASEGLGEKFKQSRKRSRKDWNGLASTVNGVHHDGESSLDGRKSDGGSVNECQMATYAVSSRRWGVVLQWYMSVLQAQRVAFVQLLDLVSEVKRDLCPKLLLAAENINRHFC